MAVPSAAADLETALSRAGYPITPAALDDFLRGVAAAPPGHDPDAWIALIAPTADEELRDALRRALDAKRAAPPPPLEPARRLACLRAALAERGLDGFVVPRADEHQGEFTPRRAERLAWISGFTGSAGAAVVLRDRARLFVDGRYTLQAAAQAARGFDTAPIAGLRGWLAETLGAGQRLGYDPRLHTRRERTALAEACARGGAGLEPVEDNPLDAVWDDQPPPPIAPVTAHDIRHAGRSSARKRHGCADELAKEGLAATAITQPDSIAWLLNIRGGDTPFTPLALSFAILHADSTVDLFVDSRKLAPGLGDHLGNGVRAHEPEEFHIALGALKGRVAVDTASASEGVFRALEAGAAEIVDRADPCALARAIKNPVELDGARAAHLRDGAALVRFLCWLDANAESGEVDEIAAADYLEARRKENEEFRSLSFPTISGAGPNGAIVHYRASEKSNRKLEPGALYLVDSGAQYLDGTTDVTRTVAVGAPGAEMRDRFTRVLKGHIALATARFPAGTAGLQLDTLARTALWRAGLDYDHGTGHGVGSYLGVHEGPQRISKAGGADTPLRPGMIVSNEPGYYKAGEYGIRIENLVAAIALDRPPGGERDLLGFETLTLAPIDRRLIDSSLLDAAERAWIDSYHARVRAALAPALDAATAGWLDSACAPLGGA